MRQLPTTLKQLRAFIMLAHTENFNAAAEELHLSQSALSSAIAKFEDTLGVTLFDRTTRRVELTSIGRDLIAPIERILSDLDGTLSDIQGVAKGERGMVTVACLYSVATRVLPHVLTEFGKLYPKVNIMILDGTTNQILRNVRIKEADIGICGECDVGADLIFSPVSTDEFCAIMNNSHALANTKKLKWRELLEQPFVAMMRGTQMRNHLDQVLLKDGLTIRPLYEASHYATVIEMVTLGLGVSTLPELALREACESLVIKRLTDPRITRTMGVVTQRYRSLSPVAYAFKLQITQALQRMNSDR